MTDEERLIRLVIYAYDLEMWYRMSWLKRIVTAKPRMPA